MARAGQLRDRIRIERQETVPDGGGGEELTWVEVATVWGALMPERGRERVSAGRIEASVAAIARVRWSAVTAAITAADRLLVAGVAYNIRSVTQPDRRRRMIEMTVERGVAV